MESNSLQLKDYQSIVNNANKVDENLFFLRVSTNKNFKIFQQLHFIAKEEQREEHDRQRAFGHLTWFTPVNLETSDIGLFFDRNEFIGFIVWTDKLIPNILTSTQIFVMKKHRRKGHSIRMMKYWVEAISDKVNEKFLIQDPNDISKKILIKLGYARIENEKIVGIKCMFLPTIG